MALHTHGGETDPRVDQLLERWEELCRQGESLSAEELCATCPELAGEVARRIAMLHAFEPLLTDGTSGAVGHLRREAAAGPSRKSATARANYRELRFHAAGGLGEVFVAQNAELNREEALKFLKRGRAGDPESCRRFLQEAEITSRLEHPGVVPIYGRGADGSGAPCYAMRFIRGETLQVAIDAFHAAEANGRDQAERSLALRELLNRFISVCTTVAYAHSRGILHRDLKPGNVMLGQYDETLVVDWGLAKPFDPEAAADGRALDALKPSVGSGAATIEVVGTLAYMSPDQAHAQPAGLSPASDIFSLGAILYVILTDRAPYRGGSRPEILEKVRRCEFPRPRHIKPAASQALEAICLKAMAMRPADRYRRALDLAADVKRWLADEPVTAWREPLVIRARRWMRRHRTLVTSTTAVLAFCVLGLAGFSTILAGKNRELGRQGLRTEQREALAIDAVRKFRDVVQANANLKNRPELASLRTTLLKEPMEFFAKLRDQLQADRDTRTEALAQLASANLDLAATAREIGSMADALRSCSESVAILERLARDHPAVSQFQNDLATARHKLGYLQSASGLFREALESYRSALAIRERLAALNSSSTVFQRNLAQSHNNIGNLLSETGRLTEALESYRQALRIRDRLARHDATDARYQHELAESYHNIGNRLAETGQTTQALESYQRAVDIRERLVLNDPTLTKCEGDLSTDHFGIGVLLQDTGRPTAAMVSYKRALTIQQRLARENPAVNEYWALLAQSHHNIGSVLKQTGQPALALQSYQQALTIGERLVRDNPAVAQFQNQLALVHAEHGDLSYRTGHPAEALESDRRALAIWEEIGRNNPAVTEFQNGQASVHYNVGCALSDLGRLTEAAGSYRRALVILERLAHENPSVWSYQSHLGDTRHNIAEIEMAQGQWRLAREDLEQAVKHQRLALAAIPNDPSHSRSLRAHLLKLAKVFQLLCQPREVIRVSRELAAQPRGEATELYNLACVLALSVPIPRGAEKEALAAEAVQTLRKAVAAGWNDAVHTCRDSDLIALHDNDDFRRLLAELFDRGFPADPLAK